MRDRAASPVIAATTHSLPQPVALEVPVRVRGFSDAGGTPGHPHEAFSEETKTVLVFAHGAVMRLWADAVPGQRVVVSNPRQHREISGWVVFSRSHPRVKGYIEVEFAQPDADFWGVRLPSEDAAKAAQHGCERWLKVPQAEPSVRPAPGAPVQPPHRAAAEQPAALAVRSLRVEPAVVPLGDLLTEPRGRSSSSDSAVTGPREERASPTAIPRYAHTGQPGAQADLEALLERRHRAAACAEQFALRALHPCEIAPGTGPAARRRWLAIAAACAFLALASAGAWQLLLSASAAAEAEALLHPPAPKVPLELLARVNVAAAVPAIEPEPVSVPGVLLPPLEISAPRAAARPATQVPAPDAPVVASAPAGLPEVGLEGVAGSQPRLLAPVEAAPKPAPVVGGAVEPPRLLQRAPVTYPAMARQSGVEGDVVIEARVDETGRVTPLRIVTGHAVLRQAALDSVQQWRYAPGTLNGKPIAMHLYVRIQFRR